jgi:hypothetical protein
MKQFFLNLLAESSNVSMTRFLSLICVLTACSIAVYGMWTKVDLNQLIGLCSTFLGFGLGAKVVQKNFEGKTELEADIEKK